MKIIWEPITLVDFKLSFTSWTNKSIKLGVVSVKIEQENLAFYAKILLDTSFDKNMYVTGKIVLIGTN